MFNLIHIPSGRQARPSASASRLFASAVNHENHIRPAEWLLLLIALAVLCLPGIALAQTSQTISLFPVGAQVYAPGGTFSVYASASSGLPVSFTTDTPAICQASGNSISMLAAGTCTVRASQPGDATYSAAPVMLDSVAIERAPQSIMFSMPSTMPLVDMSFPVSVGSTSHLPVTITSQTPAVCTFAGVTITLHQSGNCTVRVTQAGNSNYLPAAAVDAVMPITPAITQLVMGSSASAVAYGTPVTLSAEIRGFAPTGRIDFVTASGNGYVPVCTGVAMASGIATCTVPGSYLRATPVYFLATYAGDANNQSASGSYQQVVATSQSGLSAGFTPQVPLAGGSLALSAMVTQAGTGSRVTFSENGSPLPGCNNVALISVGGSGSGIGGARCDIAAVTAGAHTYVVTYPNPTGTGFDQVLLTVNVAASGPQDYTGMWWAGLAENGWGLSVDQHGAIQFVVLYVYDNAGKPIWYVMPGGSWNAAGTDYSGPLYLPTGSPFTSYDASKFTANAPVGTATISYLNATTATLAFTINGVSATKQILRQSFGDGANIGVSMGDMWWGGQQENGWGMNITQQGSVLFPVWYTYDASGRATWFVMPGGKWNGATYTGDLYQPNSSAWLGCTYMAAQFTPNKVGQLSLTFSDQNTATAVFEVNGMVRTNSIVRQSF